MPQSECFPVFRRIAVNLTLSVVAVSLFLSAGSPAFGDSEMVTIEARYGQRLTIDPESFHVYDVPDRHFKAITGIDPKWQTDEAPLQQRVSAAGAATGRVLTILVEWDNHSANTFFHPAAAYDSILYSNGIYPTGSVRDYYEEVSYGTFSITGDVVGWVSLPSLYDGWYDINEIVAAADPFVNFADYDYDNDGFVDALWLIHAGPGQEETHDPNDIWSHAYRGVNVPAGDGVALDRWSMQPEEYASGDLVSIRVFCHEYGHILNLPDLYDYDDKLVTATYNTPNDNNDHPLVDWDVMGYAGYAIMSYGNRSCPSHFSAWSRIFLGWATAVEPACLDGVYELFSVEDHSTQNIYKVPINGSGTEYFLLEYRNPRSPAMFDHLNSDFSAFFPWFTPGRDTLDAGLLVTHIDESVSPNRGTPSLPNYAVRVVDAGYDPATPWDGVSEFSEWWYPYEFRIGALFSPDDPGQTTLSPSSSPSSDGYSGPSGITITVLEQHADRLVLQIERPLAPVLDSIPPVNLVEETAVDIPVVASDGNCTVPVLLTDQLPSFAAFVDHGDGAGTLTLSPVLGDAGTHAAVIIATDGQLADSTIVTITVDAGCACPFQADLDADGSTDAVDLGAEIDVIFFSGGDFQDSACPVSRGDFNADGSVDAVDLAGLVDLVFFGGVFAADPCAP